MTDDAAAAEPMDPRLVRRELRAVAADVRRSLLSEWADDDADVDAGTDADADADGDANAGGDADRTDVGPDDPRSVWDPESDAPRSTAGPDADVDTDAGRPVPTDGAAGVRERRRRVELPDRSYPGTPEDLFPWASVALVTDPDRRRALLVRHPDREDDYGWEPPGGRGRWAESPADTAAREVREETGVAVEVTDLLLVERLAFDYGRADGVTAPVVQAVFGAVAVGEDGAADANGAGGEADTVEADEAATTGDVPPAEAPEGDAVREARWFDREALPESVQFRSLFADGDW